MAPNTPAGRPGTLTADEEEKLRQLWAVTMKVFGVGTTLEEASGVDSAVSAPVSEASDNDGKKEKKKSRLSVFKRSKGDKGADAETIASGARTSTDIHSISLPADDDKFGQNQEYKAALANTPPEELRQAFWAMVKHDHPDALLLRFLRARKWNVEKALVMMVSTMHWRLKDMHVDDDIVLNGELGAVEQAGGSDAKVKKNAQDFLTQLRMGKSYLHGLDNEGRPMCFVRARLHKAGDQTEESLEKFTVFTIETARMLLRPPIDTATVVFDLTDFSMANMDYTPVKFMIKCFEANYPESLGTVLVYKAPWVFNAVWSIVRGWLDPIVASKVHFAKNIDELQKYVPRSQIPADCGGDEKWQYAYPEPIAGENDRMKDVATKQSLLAQRKSIVERYETTVLDWVRTGREGQGADGRRQERDAVAEELRQNYWQADPYVRARSLYDRMGVIGDGGKVDFYPQARKENAKPAANTSADDLD
ncbi:CRAL/TRIO domain-containing protein [Dothidotthia symphoricarpi CBS 119687]|uniref:CRAL/TRIO domain-containing protein n=1 Tax=Dothidotthia symphoricarpi CBS 119687 TaxID=1392245 RepID=A0A6A6AFN6_9PLEO|nr:CRAL/TRIO domain-containing protein [Dothidotthia symphoricarpi CBS 119687]KAF2129754.1 CRAL/TRIO domain-containing protein [Dothidotthia symphoricarpi CBS 119687]